MKNKQLNSFRKWELFRKSTGGTIDTERGSVHIYDDQEARIALIDKTTIENGSTLGTATVLQRFHLSNHLGSSNLELDRNAALISYEEYYPFGSTSYSSGRNAAETSLKRYRYVGKERDNETGLYYYGARYYASWLCRFVSVDPLKDDYPHLNSYNYAGNKPIGDIDVDGMQGTGEEIRSQEENVKRSETYSINQDEKGNVTSVSITQNSTVTDKDGNLISQSSKKDTFNNFEDLINSEAFNNLGTSQQEALSGKLNTINNSSNNNGGIPSIEDTANNADAAIIAEEIGKVTIEGKAVPYSIGDPVNPEINSPKPEKEKNFVYEYEDALGLGLSTIESGTSDAVEEVIKNASKYTKTASRIAKVGGGAVIALNIGLTIYTISEEVKDDSFNTHSIVNAVLAITGLALFVFGVFAAAAGATLTAGILGFLGVFLAIGFGIAALAGGEEWINEISNNAGKRFRHYLFD